MVTKSTLWLLNTITFLTLHVLVILGLLLPNSVNADNFILYSYHNVAPFLTGEGTGLTYDLAKQLTRMSPAGHIFSVKILPRKRLNELMTRKSVIVPWVTPVWFKNLDPDQTSWSSPIMIDSSVYIWKAGRHTHYKVPQDLIGAKLGGIRGYRYVGVDPLVKDNKIQRTDTSSEWQLIRMILSERVDVGIIPEAGACNLIRKHKLEGQLKITQHHSFTRKIMITGASEKHLIPELNNLENNPVWITVLATYGARITPLGKRNEDNYCTMNVTAAQLTIN